MGTGSNKPNWTNEASFVDRVAEPVQRATDSAFGAAEPVRSALGGEWLGHKLHPMLNDIPIGAWTAGLALDIVEVTTGSRKLRRGADIVQTLGLVGALGAAASGIADWTRTEGEAKRYGFIHGAANMVIAGLYGGSLVARATGMRKVGIALSSVGYCLMLGSGMLGAMVAYKFGALSQNKAAGEEKGARAKRPAAKANGVVAHS